MIAACPHCRRSTIQIGRELLTGTLKPYICNACGRRSNVRYDVRNALIGIGFFSVALAFSIAIGGTEIYNRGIVVRFPVLFWGLIGTAISLIGYLLFSLAHPLKGAEETRGPRSAEGNNAL
jgi:hypothetical protein